MRSFLLNTAVILTFLSTIAHAAETIIPESAQKNLNVTIYNADRALIKDTRTVTLTQGQNILSFSNVSSQIIPHSALLQGNGIKTQEQNFNFDLIDYPSLMEKSVGSQVSIEYINPASGEITSGTAELLSFNGTSPILKIGNKIETNYPGRIIFNKLPDNLRAKPTLSIHLLAQNTGAQDLGLSYLTQGLSWRADYVAELNSSETQMNLNGLVTLTNNSDTDFKNANLQLVAGDIHTVTPVQPRAYRFAKADGMAVSMATNDMIRENLSDFYLYTLPQKTDILSKQTKQVALLSGNGIQVRKTYEFKDAFDSNLSEREKVSPNIYLSFENKAGNGLGIALPKGTIRLYKADNSGNMLLLGEDTLSHTPNGEKVQVTTGRSFDLTADMKRVQYQKLEGKNAFRATYQITIKNGGMQPADVVISQNFGNSFNISHETLPHMRETSNRVKWVIPVPANDKTTLSFELTVK